MAFRYFGKGHTVNYEIKGNDYLVKIKEVATFNHKNETDNYYFTFTINNKDFFLQTYQTFKKEDHVVKNIKYFKTDNYECFYPIFKHEQVVTDILCENNSIIYNYHDLKGKSEELDQFVKSLKIEEYDATNWIDNTVKMITDEKDHINPIVVYPNNLVKNHYVGADNYYGIYLMNTHLEGKSLYDIPIFSNDYYEKTLDARAGRFYIVADYNKKHDFSTFHLVDMVYNEIKTIKYHSPISFDSYIQGTVENAIYLFDRSTKKQYKIDAEAESIVEVGNEQTGIKYYNLGKWEEKKAIEAFTSDLYFNYYTMEPSEDYVRIDKIANELSGYYYYYKKVNNKYEVYRSNIQNPEIKTYLLTTSDIDNIEYLHDYIYYKDGNTIKYYHDTTGTRTIALNREFEFNKSLHFYLYYYTKYSK